MRRPGRTLDRAVKGLGVEPCCPPRKTPHTAATVTGGAAHAVYGARDPVSWPPPWVRICSRVGQLTACQPCLGDRFAYPDPPQGLKLPRGAANACDPATWFQGLPMYTRDKRRGSICPRGGCGGSASRCGVVCNSPVGSLCCRNLTSLGPICPFFGF
ncbi:hypothetical protein N656DRAFT_326096 [Canariomyces notabilis]|uniref:Uncharacterized protein n=1 Tax=Canariomyces notabilis TaxID=2074819 RepID=A0AAN6QH41_9PEZI|nr:hypothetical protein N656DRAFT_326096 [Canariomyces arenarius]